MCLALEIQKGKRNNPCSQEVCQSISQSYNVCSLNRVWLFAAPWTAICQVPLWSTSHRVVEDIQAAYGKALAGRSGDLHQQPALPFQPCVSHLEGESSCQSTLQMTATPAKILRATSREVPNWNHPARLLLNAKPTETIRTVKVYFCFNLLSLHLLHLLRGSRWPIHSLLRVAILSVF